MNPQEMMGPQLPRLFQVWRRPQGSRRGWEKVAGLGPMPRQEAFLASLNQYRVAGDTEYEYEYAVIEVGQVPITQQTFAAGYQTKVMKPL